ncbi:MAG: sodium/glutamate symporter [Cupriavidus sp.]|nr:sodium/glutamate symporter [Cupriavidus sp.]
MKLDTVGSLLAALLMLLIGALINRHVRVLSKYNIPDPITGGLLFAAVASTLLATTGFQLTMEQSIKPTLLLMFFAGVGLGADLKLLKRGGKALAIFLIILFPYILVQNTVGVAVARLLDLHPIFGLVGGSITLVGGHGTGAAYAERFAEVNNLQSVMELTMTVATIGLILGGLIGGPVAEYLINKHQLRAAAVDVDEPGEREAVSPISKLGMTGALAAMLAAVLASQWLAERISGGAITIPAFLWCMMSGIAMRNLLPFAGIHLDDRATELGSGVCLSLFLVMTMMALDIVDVARSAGPFLVIIALQVVFIVLYVVLVCFRFMGRDYEAAVTSAAFIGFNMGSTATAMANMGAITAKHGPAPGSFLIAPLAGAFFVDLMNAMVLTLMLALPFMGG